MAVLVPDPRASSGVAWRRLLPALAFLLVVACANLVPRQGWDPQAGPVVPHDSFPADCTLCHLGGDWRTLRPDFAYDHEKQAGVALRGAHAQAGCLLCHNDRGPVQQFAARGCGGCHADPHLGRLGANCQDCHEERTWFPRQAIADHDRTRFPLVGQHAAAACFRCHPGAQVGNFAGAYVVCSQCHADDYARTAAPNHAAVQFGQDCERCHVPTGWQSARFDHPAAFPLSLGHGGRRCSDCHPTSNSFAGLAGAACSQCHLDDYTAATNPPHAAAGFGSDCAQCHDASTWRRSSWPHVASFPLSLGHAGRACAECHQGGVYVGTPSACVACHQDDYTATNAPNHATAGFGTDCAQCHGTARWGSGSFIHRFPITNGPHGGLACTTCHTTPGNYAAFSCIDCHAHRQSAMANEHDEVSGYVWASANCYQCHPNGRH